MHHRLLYISTARTILTPAELADVLRVSRRNNAAAGVSGLLIVGGRRFLQALEGPEAAVRATYKRILADPRHFAVVVLSDQPVEKLTFSEWAMGYQPGRKIAEAGRVSDDVALLLEPIADPALRGYFAGFVEQHAAAA